MLNGGKIFTAPDRKLIYSPERGMLPAYALAMVEMHSEILHLQVWLKACNLSSPLH